MARNDTKKSAQTAARPAPKPVPWPTAVTLFWPAAVLGAAADIGSKAAVFAWLSSRQPPVYVIIDGFLQFVLRENTGAAFSAFQGWTGFLITISAVALAVLLVAFFSRKVTSKGALLAMGCITGGIIGNLYDRLFNAGRVRDFIDVYIGAWDWHWPTFNIADSLLCIGVGLLIIINLRADNE